VTGCLIQATGGENDCRSILREELLRHAYAGAGTFEVDVDQRDIRSLAA
jgi:hypothetical protein